MKRLMQHTLNALKANLALLEHILIIHDCFPLPDALQGERAYYALFSPAFHEDCFLSLFVTPTKAEMVLGQVQRSTSWHEEAKQAWLNGDAFPPLPDPFLSRKGPKGLDIQMVPVPLVASVPLESLRHFERSIQAIAPLTLDDRLIDGGRDGMVARGMLVDAALYSNGYEVQRRDSYDRGISKRENGYDKSRVHRFDILTVAPLTARHVAFFQTLIETGLASFDFEGQKKLREIQFCISIA